jgi:ribonuclease E
MAYVEAKEFMRMLMPSHAKNVKPYRDSLPIFTRHGIGGFADAMFTPVSSRPAARAQSSRGAGAGSTSTRARHPRAPYRGHRAQDQSRGGEEIARQLRLRFAGLINTDFIDMDEKRNNRAVERRLKACGTTARASRSG